MADVTINSIQDLLAFASGQYGYGSSSDYLDVELGADLDFADYDDTYSFAGCPGDWYLNFDGKGHKIDNIQYTGGGNWGFIIHYSGQVTITNLDLTNLYVITTASAGGVYFSTMGGTGLTIRNCHVSGQIESARNNTVSGLSQHIYRSANISYSSFSGTLKSVNGSACGVCPDTQGGNTISNVMINANLQSGWCCCIAAARSTVVNSEYRGTVNATNGIVVPVGNSSTATNCILVINEDSTAPRITTENATVSNTYIDATKLAQTGISHPSYITEATTAQLKDAAWLKSKGFAL